MQQIQSMHSGDIVVMNGKLLVCGVEFCDCERILREYENDSIMVLKRAGGESILVYRNGSANAGLVYQEIDLISTDCLSYIGRRTEKSGEEVWDYVYGSTVRTFASVRVVKSVDRMNCAYGAGHILLVGTTTENVSVLCYGHSALSLGIVAEGGIRYMDRERSSSSEHLRGRTILTLRTVSWSTACWVLEDGMYLQGPFAHKPYALTRSGEAIVLNVSEDGNRVEGICIGSEHHDLTDLYQEYGNDLKYVHGSVTDFRQFSSFTVFRIHSGSNRAGKWYDHTLIWSPEKGFQRFTGISYTAEVGGKPFLTISGEVGQVGGKNRLYWGEELIGPAIDEVLQVSMGENAPIVLFCAPAQVSLIQGNTVLDANMRKAYVPAYNESGKEIGLGIRYLPVGTKAVYAKRESDGTEGVYVNGQRIIRPLIQSSIRKILAFKTSPGLGHAVKVSFLDGDGKQGYDLLRL